MKKIVSLLLLLALLCAGAALAEEAAPTAETAALPEVGEVVYGFEVKEIRDLPLIGATVVYFEHQKTGAGLTYIANEDTNRVFDLTFLTRPIDNTGLPHIFEHSTLDGSEKYPSKQLFFNLSYQTYNTYMNASTYDVMTTYPVASLSEAQLLNYADYYTDSCLHPIVMEDESIFREEAWRYRLASLEDDLTIEGTVYSEMLGAWTLQRAASLYASTVTFPGSVVGYEQGGLPASIPDMTWASLKEYHNLFYHPSNCMAYLYGEFEDYTAFVKLLDEAFSDFEREEFHFEDSEYEALTESVEMAIAHPMEATSNPNNNSVIYYTYLCPGLKSDTQAELVVDTLTDLLGSGSSPLMQSLRRVLPSGTFYCYINESAPDDAVTFVAQNVNQEDAQTFKDTVDAALRELAETGFAQDMVDGVMASLAMDIRLTPEASDVGVNVIPSFAYSYATNGNPFGYIDYVDALDQLDAWNQAGLYQEALSTWLGADAVTAMVTTYPVPGLKEELDAMEAERLAAVKASMTEEELLAIVEASNAVEPEEDTSAMVAALQAVTVASLPEEIKTYDVIDETVDGIRYVNALAGVEGIGQVAIFLDAHGLPQEEIHFFKLFTQLIGDMDTSAHTREELDVLTDRYLYDGEIRLSLLDADETEEYRPYLRMGWKGMDEDLETAYDLMRELVFDTDLTNVAQLRDNVQALKASMKTSLTNSIYSVLVYRAFAEFHPLYRYYNYINYLDYYAFLEQVEEALDTMPEVVVAGLQDVQQYFANRSGAMVAYAGSEEGNTLNRACAERFLGALANEPITHVDYDLPVPAASEGIIVDVNVQYNALIGDFEQLGLEGYEGSLDAITALVSDVYLMPLLRDQYGAYGCMHYATQDGGVYIVSYRDPNVAETFAVYDQLADLVAGLEVDQDTLDGYILSSYAGYAMSTGELTGAMSAVVSRLNGDDPAEVLDYMRQLKAVTPEMVTRAAEMYRRLSGTGVRSTAGGAGAVSANAELYDVILNPFGTVDSSEVELADVPEDSEYYEAVRFVFENGLMQAMTEDTFGVDETATVGDLAGALYVIIGGDPGVPEEAVDYLSQFGIVPENSADEPMTNGDSDAIFVNFGEAIQFPLEADEPNETTDQPITRGELADQIYLLCTFLGLD